MAGKTQFASGGANDQAVFNKFLMFPNTTGNIWFVDSVNGSSSGSGYSPGAAYATVAQALSVATANNGDKIYLMPGHVESIGAAGLAWNKAGIEIIGLGTGSNRPTFTWHTTDAVVTISAANVSISNIRTTVDVDEVVSMFLVTGANVTMDKVDHVDATTTQAIQWLLTTNAADYLTIKNCRHYQLTAPATASKWIQLVGPDGALICDNYFRLVLANSAASITISLTTDGPACEICRNVIVQTGGTTQASAILLTTGTGAFVHDNRVACGSTALPGIVAVGSAGYGSENYALNTAAVSGLLDPVADS